MGDSLCPSVFIIEYLNDLIHKQCIALVNNILY